MKIEIKITKNDWKKEYQIESSSLTILGKIWEEQDLIGELSNGSTIKYFKDAISGITGFFSLVYRSGDSLFAAVDHTRSHPLFYGTLDETFYLSDDAEWVRKKLKEERIDPLTKEEFLLTGFVTGSNTLFSNLKQLQAGEYIFVNSGNFEVKRYFRFQHIEPSTWDESVLFSKLDDVARKSILRLIEY
jgi:asparagine synthase (glutamine-hydrolysing)